VTSATGRTTSLLLSSADLADGGALPIEHAAATAGGRDCSPALSWTSLPGVASYAVTCYDPDAPTGSGVWHWVLADLPGTTTCLRRGAEGVGRSFVNDLGGLAYAGAAPPPGLRHRYEFRVHGLDIETLPLPAGAPNVLARYLITTHSLAAGVLTVTFEGPSA
jgi:Raf kinase inhibitor-like YbhB/YbcL family protein